MSHAGRADACDGQLIVEPGGDPATEVRANRMVERWRYLKEHEHRADGDKRRSKRIAASHGTHERAHRDSE